MSNADRQQLLRGALGELLLPLARPRELSARERELLEALIAPLGVEELGRQVRTAKVVSVCSCGCPSVGLSAEGPRVPPAVALAVDDTARDGTFGVKAWASNDEGRDVEVALHVIEGTVFELEIWSGWDGGDVHTSVPPAASLRPW